MPCYDPRDDDDRRENKRRLDTATRLLCELLQMVDARAPEVPLTDEMLAWWAEHRRLDDGRPK